MATKILIVDRVYKRSKAIFDKAQEFEFISVTKEEDAVASMIERVPVSAVVLATDKYCGKLYCALPEGGLIARYGVGHDSIDKAKATAAKQFVTITSGVLDNSVAEHAMFLLGSITRHIATKDAVFKNNEWSKSTGHELSGKTLLIVGCGAIGKKLAKIASFGFGMEVVAYDVAKLDADKLKDEFGITLVQSLDEALAKADVVSIHLPAIEATRDFVNSSFISKMKKNSVLINTSRGSVVDEDALYDALDSGVIMAAGLDVFKNEPYQPTTSSKDLRKLDNVVLTPHLGSSTQEASDKMAESVLENIRLWQEGEFSKLDLVNTDVIKAVLA